MNHSLEKYEVLGKNYYSAEDVDNYIHSLEEQQQASEFPEYTEKEYVFPSIKSILLHTIKTTAFWLLVLSGILLVSDLIALNFGYDLKWNAKVFELLKVLFIICGVSLVSKIAKFCFKDYNNNHEKGVPSPKTIVTYIANSYLTYVAISSFLYTYAINFEALGVENLKNIVATVNIASMLLASVMFTMYRFFNGVYKFIFSTVKDDNDSNSLWKDLTSYQKFTVSLSLFLVMLGIFSYIYVSVSYL